MQTTLTDKDFSEFLKLVDQVKNSVFEVKFMEGNLFEAIVNAYRKVLKFIEESLTRVG